ncbi:hypothetical protein CEXT_253811 [Caerostris extrusa]|uniref:Uncharacterized protein n=1 Tax=Caerostris extrusa TaxID=172846 RepID=A0AAV4XDD5_CAEEX|nr:hypothetical protein CEXT_253811 [Caerostris extrusa]
MVPPVTPEEDCWKRPSALQSLNNVKAPLQPSHPPTTPNHIIMAAWVPANLTHGHTRTVKGMAPPQMKSRLEMIRKGPGTIVRFDLKELVLPDPQAEIRNRMGCSF